MIMWSMHIQFLAGLGAGVCIVLAFMTGDPIGAVLAGMFSLVAITAGALSLTNET